MNASGLVRTGTLALACAILATACDSGNVTPTPQAAQPTAETTATFGDYELHFNAVRTDQLTADIARTYGIERSTNRVLLNVALLHRPVADDAARPVDGAVSVNAYNLAGQLRTLEMRRITEGNAIYYIGEVPITGTERLRFDISVTPAGQSQVFTSGFQREFFAE